MPRLSAFAPALAAAALCLGSVCTAQAITPIGAVQGSVPAGSDGVSFASPMEKQQVMVRGVVTGKTLALSKGEESHGFFIQNSKSDADHDPNSSDGIYIFTGRYAGPRSKVKGAESYTPELGDEIEISGTVAEYFKQTQLSRTELARVVRKGVDLDKEVPAIEANPPLEEAAAGRYWERLEGMRVRIPAGALAQGGLHAMGRAGDWWQWLSRANQTPGKPGSYAQRIFRDAHPLDNVPDKVFDDGNGYRMIIGSLALRAAQNNVEAKLPEARTFDTLQHDAVGCVEYAFDHYVILPEAVEFANGPDPAQNEPPQEPDRAHEFTLATFNMENVYDLRDNPFSATDAAGDPGSGTIKPPFNYLPKSQAEYDNHIAAVAREVIQNLKSPDLILGQELENQDIMKIEGGRLIPALQDGKPVDHADGRPDTAEDICLAIKQAGGPDYDCAYDPAAADDRGIVPVYFYRTDRVELLKPAEEPFFGPTPPVAYDGGLLATTGTAQRNPRAINGHLPKGVVPEDQELAGDKVFTRATQVAGFRIFSKSTGEAADKNPFVTIYALDNHLSSRPDARVLQRTEQARLMAAIMTALVKAKGPHTLVVSGGDFNNFPRPDDPFPGKPSDQFKALYAAGMSNVFDTLVRQVPASAYTYVYEGQAQTLDQMYLSPALQQRLKIARVAHVNADFSELENPLQGEAARRATDHDPMVVRFGF